MNRLDNAAYMAEVDALVSLPLPWERLNGKSIAVTGATGMIGTMLIDVLLRLESRRDLGLNVIALGRNREKALARLPYFDSPRFAFHEGSIEDAASAVAFANYVFHLASSTHPRAYASDPIGTVVANVDGLRAMLDLAARTRKLGQDSRVLFSSSVEIYGENRGDVERFSEDYSGYIDCNTLRACYTEAKRLGEALCQAYISQRGIEVVIPRIARAYGPTLQKDDSKALSQFIHCALSGEDVVLKSPGLQLFSYLYDADVVSGLLYVLLKGGSGEAYNLSDEKSDVRLRDLAELVAQSAGVKVIHDVADKNESAGYSKASVALMDSSKAKSLGWHARYSMKEGIQETLSLLKSID